MRVVSCKKGFWEVFHKMGWDFLLQKLKILVALIDARNHQWWYLSVNSLAPELTARVQPKGRVKVRVRDRVKVRVRVSVSVSLNMNNLGADKDPQWLYGFKKLAAGTSRKSTIFGQSCKLQAEEEINGAQNSNCGSIETPGHIPPKTDKNPPKRANLKLYPILVSFFNNNEQSCHSWCIN